MRRKNARKGKDIQNRTEEKYDSTRQRQTDRRQIEGEGAEKAIQSGKSEMENKRRQVE